MDTYRIDSHKLMYHVSRVHDWLEGRTVYPLYVEVSPCGSCNHRCVFCAYDFVGYRTRFLDAALLKDRLGEMASLGIKSVLYSGEGEPLLHKDCAAIINHTRRAGIDPALASNGVLLDAVRADELIASLSWMKISMNAGTKETYASIHRCPAKDFERALKNLAYAVRLKRRGKYGCTIGVQALLLPENAAEMVTLAKKARDIGVDYLVVKPYSQHPLSVTTRYKNIHYARYLRLADALKALSTARFEVIVRTAAMKKWDEGVHAYRHCYALPFWAHIDSAGDVWGCPMHMKDKRFNCGNIYASSFQMIWQGHRRKKMLDLAHTRLAISRCRVNCRMDEINRYLWELKNPPAHVNFI